MPFIIDVYFILLCYIISYINKKIIIVTVMLNAKCLVECWGQNKMFMTVSISKLKLVV